MSDEATALNGEPPKKGIARLPTVVFWLGLVSLATDAASEMIYPLLPVFLTTVLGAGLPFVGLVEGIAETTASVLKLWSGHITDGLKRRKPLTLMGYSLSTLTRPLIGLATAPWMVLAVRVSDRVGKGLRSSPRDALLADSVPPTMRGRAYGFHRAMDNAGAVIGPLIATVLLGAFDFSLRKVFLCAAIPGIVALGVLVFKVREPVEHLAHGHDSARADEKLSPAFRRYIVVLALFSLANSSDAFLLVRAKQVGIDMALIPVLWMAHNGVRALFSTTAGALSDRFGRKPLVISGWIIYALCYVGFALTTHEWQIWVLLPAYGCHYALVEGSEKAWVADLAGRGNRGRAFGMYHGVTAACALPASLLFGLVAGRFGEPVAFGAAAGMAAVSSVLLLLLVDTTNGNN